MGTLENLRLVCMEHLAGILFFVAYLVALISFHSTSAYLSDPRTSIASKLPHKSQNHNQRRIGNKICIEHPSIVRR